MEMVKGRKTDDWRLREERKRVKRLGKLKDREEIKKG